MAIKIDKDITMNCDITMNRDIKINKVNIAVIYFNSHLNIFV